MEILNQAMPTWLVIVVGLASYGLRWLQTRQSTPAVPTVPAIPGMPDVAMPPGEKLTIGNGLLVKLFLDAFKAGLSASPILPAAPSPPPVPADDVEAILQKLRELLKSPGTPAV